MWLCSSTSSVWFCFICVLIVCEASATQAVVQGNKPVKVRECEPINVDLCLDRGYDVTGMPNQMGHETQREAEDQLRTFTPLIQYGCSSRLVFFLCSAYLPMCTVHAPNPIGPCRPLCESVRQRCQPILNQFGFPWPINLNCSKFLPLNNQEHMCMEGPDEEERGKSTTKQSRTILPTSPLTSDHLTSKVVTCDMYRRPEKYVLLNSSQQKCALICPGNIAFSSGQKQFADVWMSVWSGLCFLFTFIAILTFLLNANMFRYPDRVVVIITGCYNIVSVAYIIRLIAGRDAVSCYKTSDSPPSSVFVHETINNTDCAVVFLLFYYFLLASCVWWVILSFLWFSTVRLRWSPDFIGRHSAVLHAIAWSVPAILTIAVLVPRSVDADELTGMCFVDHHNSTAQLAIVVCPISVCLFLGLVFTTAGFVALHLRIRYLKRCMQELIDNHRNGDGRHHREGIQDGQNSENTGDIRNGIFCLIYVVLFTSITACYCYDYANHPKWYLAGHTDEPNVELLMFKIAVSLIPGIVSGLLTLDSKAGRNSLLDCFQKLHCICIISLRHPEMNKLPVNKDRCVMDNRSQLSTLMHKPEIFLDDDDGDIKRCKSCHRHHYRHGRHHQTRYHQPKRRNILDKNLCINDHSGPIPIFGVRDVSLHFVNSANTTM